MPAKAAPSSSSKLGKADPRVTREPHEPRVSRERMKVRLSVHTRLSVCACSNALFTRWLCDFVSGLLVVQRLLNVFRFARASAGIESARDLPAAYLCA